MDGRGRFMDNIFIERLWRSLKYEAVYLHKLENGDHARQVVGSWIDSYSHARPYSSQHGRTPVSVCLGRRPGLAGESGTWWAAASQAASRLLHFVPALRVTGCRPARLCWPWPEGNFRP